jgi:hypothetical protein
MKFFGKSKQIDKKTEFTPDVELRRACQNIPLAEKDAHFLFLDKEMITKLDFSLLKAAHAGAFSRLVLRREISPIEITISGYEQDFELYEVSEVRKYCQVAYKEFTAIFIFLTTNTLKWFFPCITEVSIKDRKPGVVQFTYKILPTSRIIGEIYTVCRRALKSVSESQEEFDRLSDEVRDRLRNMTPYNFDKLW